MVYEIIDYDNEDEIDFVKFCMLNTDKSNNIYKLIEEMKERKQQ